MIYLSTGANGSCKTLFTLKDVRDLQLKDLRPVYYVQGRFKPKEILTKDFGWLPFDFKDWQTLPSGSIILCDEVHNDLPKRPTNAPVPEHIKMIAEHRARGFDFFMMTQHPSNLDSFVTRIIGAPGWHRHLKRVAGGSSVTSVLQWDAVNNTCERAGSGKTAQVTMRAQPKEVYGWYESAELHTGKLKIPKAAIYLAVSLPIICALFYFAFHLMYARTQKPASAVDLAGAPGQTSAGLPAGNQVKPKTSAEYMADYRPRFPGLMHTAPVYDELTKPKRVPVAAACIASASKGCKCFTQDATPYPIDEAMCRGLLEHGSFYAFQPEGERAGRVEPIQTRVLPVAQAGAQDVGGVTLIGGAPAVPAAVPEAPPMPQRIASVKR